MFLMPIPADVQMRQIKKNLVGKEGSAKIKVLKDALQELPGYFSGPHGKLRKWILEEIERSKVKRGLKSRDRFQIPREGHCQIIILGQPNAGKSSLLKALTGRQLKVADYPFATLMPTAATLAINDAYLQLVEIPGLIEGVNQDKGMGRALLAAARNADYRLLAADLTQDPASLQVLISELEQGELEWQSPLLGTRADMVDQGQLQAWQDFWPGLDILPCSTITEDGMDEVRQALWTLSGLLRVWCGDASGRPEEKPMILEAGGTVTDFAASIHKDLVDSFKFGRVWGKSARFPGQQVGPEHLLEDGDIVHLARR